jgi:murein DD-endopeptidase MepM/ murein hydrolase activator NlpD
MYAHVQAASSSQSHMDAVKRMDMIYKKAFVQSRSYDEVSLLAKRADEMAQCVPAIPPVALENVRLSSLFGYRTDPVYGGRRMHQGVDLSGDKGEPIYAPGDGTVVTVKRNYFGYGREIVVDHGFGYQTRYAHLNTMLVKVGDKVSRGDQIATMGNTGKSKGVHLHYEVIYRERRVNPLNYYNEEVKGKEYMEMVRPK